MSNETKTEYVAATAGRYHRAGRKYKKLILDEFCRTWGCHRKHAIRLLNKTQPHIHRSRGAQPKYDADAISFLEDIWLATNRLCSKLLKAALPTWMPYYLARLYLFEGKDVEFPRFLLKGLPHILFSDLRFAAVVDWVRSG